MDHCLLFDIKYRLSCGFFSSFRLKKWLMSEKLRNVFELL